VSLLAHVQIKQGHAIVLEEALAIHHGCLQTEEPQAQFNYAS
jgi:hypothetical protein